MIEGSPIPAAAIAPLECIVDSEQWSETSMVNGFEYTTVGLVAGCVACPRNVRDILLFDRTRTSMAEGRIKINMQILREQADLRIRNSCVVPQNNLLVTLQRDLNKLLESRSSEPAA